MEYNHYPENKCEDCETYIDYVEGEEGIEVKCLCEYK